MVQNGLDLFNNVPQSWSPPLYFRRPHSIITMLFAYSLLLFLFSSLGTCAIAAPTPSQQDLHLNDEDEASMRLPQVCLIEKAASLVNTEWTRVRHF